MMWYQIDAYTMTVVGIVGLYLIYILLFVELRMWLSGIPAVPTTFMERYGESLCTLYSSLQRLCRLG